MVLPVDFNLDLFCLWQGDKDKANFQKLVDAVKESKKVSAATIVLVCSPFDRLNTSFHINMVRNWAGGEACSNMQMIFFLTERNDAES